VPTDLYPSRLSDGICDCCDGSDEPKGACRNTCAVHARRKLEDIKAKLVQFEAGLNTRSQYVASSANALNDARAELQSAEAEAADLEKNFNALRQQLKEARRKAEGEQRTAVDDEDSTEPPSVEEMLLKNSVRQYFSKLASPHEMDPQVPSGCPPRRSCRCACLRLRPLALIQQAACRHCTTKWRLSTQISTSRASGTVRSSRALPLTSCQRRPRAVMTSPIRRASSLWRSYGVLAHPREGAFLCVAM